MVRQCYCLCGQRGDAESQVILGADYLGELSTLKSVRIGCIAYIDAVHREGDRVKQRGTLRQAKSSSTRSQTARIASGRAKSDNSPAAEVEFEHNRDND